MAWLDFSSETVPWYEYSNIRTGRAIDMMTLIWCIGAWLSVMMSSIDTMMSMGCLRVNRNTANPSCTTYQPGPSKKYIIMMARFIRKYTYNTAHHSITYNIYMCVYICVYMCIHICMYIFLSVLRLFE